MQKKRKEQQEEMRKMKEKILKKEHEMKKKWKGDMKKIKEMIQKLLKNDFIGGKKYLEKEEEDRKKIIDKQLSITIKFFYEKFV